MDTDIEQLLLDRRNGMGLQKAARKYKMGIPKIRKIEAENGMAPEPYTKKDPMEELQRHFQEVQDSFAIVMDELDGMKAEMRKLIRMNKIDEEIEDVEEYEEDLEEYEDEDEKPQKVDSSAVYASLAMAAVGWGLAFYMATSKPKQT